MSHDRRTPMNVILGMTQIAQKYKNDPEFPEGTVKPERSFIVGVKFNF